MSEETLSGGGSCAGAGRPVLAPAVASHKLDQPRASGDWCEGCMGPKSQRCGGLGFRSPGLPQQVLLKAI